jgi:hypothetical protein
MFFTYLEKNHIPKFYATFTSLYFNNFCNNQGIIHFVFCLFLNYDNNVIINV